MVGGARQGPTEAALILLGLPVAWVAANRQQVEGDSRFDSTTASLALIIFVAAAAGWILGIVTPFAIRYRARHRR